MTPEEKKTLLSLRKRVEELERQVNALTCFLKECIEFRLQPEMTDYEDYINGMLP